MGCVVDFFGTGYGPVSDPSEHGYYILYSLIYLPFYSSTNWRCLTPNTTAVFVVVFNTTS